MEQIRQSSWAVEEDAGSRSSGEWWLYGNGKDRVMGIQLEFLRVVLKWKWAVTSQD